MHKFRSLYTVSMVIETKVVIGWLKTTTLNVIGLTLNVIGLLNYPITNLASESVGNRSFFKPVTIEEIAIFMIKNKITFRLSELAAILLLISHKFKDVVIMTILFNFSFPFLRNGSFALRIMIIILQWLMPTFTLILIHFLAEIAQGNIDSITI